MNRIFAAALAAAVMAAPVTPAQERASEGPLDISADRGEVFDAEGRVVYTGDANVVRGATRLRADRIEAFFTRGPNGGFSDLERIIAQGEVYYVTEGEIARGDEGVYDLVEGVVTLTGSVVLTQGCNVSTGETLVVNIESGAARLTGGQENQRVRSVFFEDDETATQDDCPPPTIPGSGPVPFEG
jgi:lipopolysaccharide export system protein LptA